MNDKLNKFIWNISHDLRTPIRTISISADMAIDNLKGTIDEESLNLLEHIHYTSISMDALVDDLLEYTKLFDADSELEEVNLNQTLSLLLQDLDSSVKLKNAKVIVNKLPKIRTNPQDIKRIFHNLISNALTYARDEVDTIISITDKTDPSNNDSYEIHVEDNGIGIDPKFKEQIFNPFIRLVNRDQYHGSGLGLATVRQILNNLKGKISVESEVGKGSNFILSLPKT